MEKNDTNKATSGNREVSAGVRRAVIGEEEVQ